jgi:hypothetical protein
MSSSILSNKLKNYAANVILKPHETLTVKFPHRYFNRNPTITSSASVDTQAIISNVTKDYFTITNNTRRRVKYSFVACLTTSKEIFIQDSDNDGISDDNELLLGTNPNLADSDTDGLSDYFEVNNFGTNPLDTDTDDDNFDDYLERVIGSDPLNPDSDGDGILDGDEINIHSTSPMLSDTDNDGYTDLEEITAGSSPIDPTSTPAIQSTSTLYFALNSSNTHDYDKDFVTIYSGEMFNLEYPQITDLQPDSSGNTQYEVINSSDNNTNKNNFDDFRIYSLNSNDYSNTSPPSAIYKLDNLNKNQTYKILALNDNSPPSSPGVNSSLTIKMTASNIASENSSNILNNNVSNSLLNYDGNEDDAVKYHWIHSFSIDDNNNVSFNSQNTQVETKFYDESIAYLMFHTNYTLNTDSSVPDVEIAIQSADFASDADVSSYAGYISEFEYTIQDIQSQDDAFDLVSNSNYSAISTNINNDLNVNNQARFNVAASPRQRYRMHVKVGQGTNCDFKIHINTVGMMDWLSNFSQSIDNYNNTYDNNSSLTYYNLIPDDSNTNQRVYYYFFTVREDGFVIWENN